MGYLSRHVSNYLVVPPSDPANDICAATTVLLASMNSSSDWLLSTVRMGCDMIVLRPHPVRTASSTPHGTTTSMLPVMWR